MQIVILGAGVVGTQVAQLLSQQNHGVVLIEKQRQRAAVVQTRVDCRVIIDEGARRDTLVRADIATADYFVAATDSDEVNLIACDMAKQLSKNKDIKCIARIRSKEYWHGHKDVEDLFRVDYIVQPEREAALAIIRSIEYGGGVSDVFTFEDFGHIIMRNFVVSSQSIMKGMQLKDLIRLAKIPRSLEGKFLVALINRHDQSVIPTGSTVFEEKDELFILGDSMVLDALFGYLGKRIKEAKDIRKILIIGGGEVGVQLVDCYLNTQENNLSRIIGKRRFATRDITIVEKDLTRCRQLADMFHNITILNANVSEEGVFEEMEINSFDMVISATESQERNIVLAAHSQKLGVRHTIALVDTQVYLRIANELGIGYSLSIKNEVTESIRKYLSGQMSLYSIIRERSYEILRVDVHEKSKYAFTKVMNIRLPQFSILLCVHNPERGTVIASGNTLVEPGDTVLCLVPTDAAERMRNIFGEQPIEGLIPAQSLSSI